MKKSNEVKELCKKYFPWWIQFLGLSTWDIKVDYYKGKPKLDETGFRTFATCSADWTHMTALICVYPKTMRALSEWGIEETIVHELIHILVNEMRYEGICHEERTVSHLAKTFMWVRDNSKDDRTDTRPTE